MALPNDSSRITDALAKLESANPNYTNPKKEVSSRALVRKSYLFYKAAVDGAAGTATAYTAAPFMRMKNPGRVIGMGVCSNGAVTADATNNAVVSAVVGDGAGGAGVIAASLTTDIAGGSWVAGSAKIGTLSATLANRQFAAGQVLGFAIAKGGTGVAIPICQVYVDVEEEGGDAYPV